MEVAENIALRKQLSVSPSVGGCFNFASTRYFNISRQKIEGQEREVEDIYIKVIYSFVLPDF